MDTASSTSQCVYTTTASGTMVSCFNANDALTMFILEGAVVLGSGWLVWRFIKSAFKI